MNKMVEYIPTNFEIVWGKIEDISIPGKCSCDRINKELNKIVRKYSIQNETDHPVCCVICCGCHMEKIYEEQQRIHKVFNYQRMV